DLASRRQGAAGLLRPGVRDRHASRSLSDVLQRFRRDGIHTRRVRLLAGRSGGRLAGRCAAAGGHCAGGPLVVHRPPRERRPPSPGGRAAPVPLWTPRCALTPPSLAGPLPPGGAPAALLLACAGRLAPCARGGRGARPSFPPPPPGGGGRGGGGHAGREASP